jgi:membrane-bound lytic murein transglycosylase D
MFIELANFMLVNTMEVAVREFRQIVSRARRRALFPALAVAVGITTLVGGLERTEYLRASSPIVAAAVAADRLVADSSVAVAAESSVATDSGSAGLDLTVRHPRIDQWVHRLTTSLKGDVQQSLGRMNQYAQMITKKLDDRGMPRELIYLAMIESNFNPTARSRVSAVGLWQFMSGTARQLGLLVGRGRDDRKDPAKSTDAALTYLSDLHTRFGSWYLAAAAYNSGAGTVSKALRKVTGKTTGTDEDFFRILAVLPKETQDYVPKLIATAMVGSEPEKYGL